MNCVNSRTLPGEARAKVANFNWLHQSVNFIFIIYIFEIEMSFESFFHLTGYEPQVLVRFLSLGLLVLVKRIWRLLELIFNSNKKIN